MVGKILTGSEKFQHGWKKDGEGYMQDYVTKLCKLTQFVSLVLVLNPVTPQLYPVLLSHLMYLVTFYVLVLLSFSMSYCTFFYVLVN
jgi:hypothetical protein